MEVEKLRKHYDMDVRWAPFLLDPSIPPEGRTREPYTKPGDPPSALELRGERCGITFRRGRTHTPNSHLSLETAEYAQELGHDGDELHRALFRTHFEEDGNIGDLDTLLQTRQRERPRRRRPARGPPRPGATASRSTTASTGRGPSA